MEFKKENKYIKEGKIDASQQSIDNEETKKSAEMEVFNPVNCAN